MPKKDVGVNLYLIIMRRGYFKMYLVEIIAQTGGEICAVILGLNRARRGNDGWHSNLMNSVGFIQSLVIFLFRLN